MGFLTGGPQTIKDEALPKMGLHQKCDTVQVLRPVTQHSSLEAQPSTSHLLRSSKSSENVQEDGLVEIAVTQNSSLTAQPSTSHLLCASESSETVQEDGLVKIPEIYSYKPNWRRVTLFDSVHRSEYTSWTFRGHTEKSSTDLVNKELITRKKYGMPVQGRDLLCPES